MQRVYIHKKNTPRKWSELSYTGEKRVPAGIDPTAGSWPTFFLQRNNKGEFIDQHAKPIAFQIRYPDIYIDFEGEQLRIVRHTLQNISEKEKQIAKYWGDGPPTKQWTPIIDRLIDTYAYDAPRAARVLAAVQAAFNDALVVAWYFKFLWQIPRPNQLDQSLKTLLCTPKHPSYPSGHAVVAGCAEIILSYFFPPEAKKLRKLAEECAISRLYSGVHFPIDNSEGLRLGRHIGQIIVEILKEQRDLNQTAVDYLITVDKKAALMPPPYKQLIPFNRKKTCLSLEKYPQQEYEDIFDIIEEILIDLEIREKGKEAEETKKETE